MSERAPSIRSVASSASGVSLSRRPRTRTRSRSRTVSGASGRPIEPPLDSLPISSDLPYLSGPITHEPVDDESQIPSTSNSEDPSRPARSQQPQGLLEPAGELGVSSRSSDTASSQLGTAVDATVVVEPPPPSTPSPVKPVKPGKASSLPQLQTGYKPPPSAFSRDPALTPTVNVRDSVSTQRSGASSSLYPPSTPTVSRPESPTTPQSMAHPIDTYEPPPSPPEVQEVREYDSDDVAYRLRLLVKNNYFLPPAHSKPSAADFALSPTDASKKPVKSPSPTFLDLFRVGKSKSKPTTPTGPAGADFPIPMLRTTSDSITASYAVRTQQPRPSGQFPRGPSPITPTAPRGRVVVVREKVEDIMVAAKQAEQDLKSKGAARPSDQNSQKGKSNGTDDIIDPTDAVDIPLPSPTYPFAVQASALHGLGVQQSVGAAALADRLPPNMSHSFDPIEHSWRKNLLQQAVHLSLDNSPDISSFSHILDTSTPPPRSKSMETPRTHTPATLPSSSSPPPPVPLPPALLEQKIIGQPMIDIIESTPTKQKRPKSSGSQQVANKSRSTRLTVNTSHGSSRPGSFLPQRVDTPSGPMTPLAPAPKRLFMIPTMSLSQTDLTISSPSAYDQSFNSFSDRDSHRSLRRTHSSPQLAEGYETAVSRQDELIPPLPPFSRNSDNRISQALSVDTLQGSYKTIAGSGRAFLIENGDSTTPDDVEPPPRPSIATSRPSISEYSQASAAASPTTSAFQELLNRPDSAWSEPHAGPSRFSLDRGPSPSIRYSAMSPPPRMSSSLAHVALPPPPRSTSLGYRSMLRSQFAPFSSSSDSSRTRPDDLDEEAEATLQIIAPEPTTPPLPDEDPGRREERKSLERRRKASAAHVPPALTLSDAQVPVKIHSAPGPTSPTNFFDDLQAQPNAMDDLESSDEEDGDTNGQVVTAPPKLFSDPRSRAISAASPNTNSTFSNASTGRSIMKHGNFSTPYIRPGGSMNASMLPVGHNIESKKPVANIPLKLGKSELPSSSYDFFKYAQEHPPPGAPFTFGGDSGSGGVSPVDPPRPATADRANMGPSTSKMGGVVMSQTAQESYKKLDGMLLRHMEDEKDTIKRIATTLRQANDLNSSRS